MEKIVKWYNREFKVNEDGEVWIKRIRRTKDQDEWTKPNSLLLGGRKDDAKYLGNREATGEGNGMIKNVYWHVLVAQAFVPPTDINPDGTPIVGEIEVSHEDGNNRNNKACNLRWCDRTYNNRHRSNSLPFAYLFQTDRKAYYKEYYKYNRDKKKENSDENQSLQK